MLNAVSTNETYFFRNKKHFDALFEVIIPKMMDNYRRPIRIWSAGCSTGEEAYTVVMGLMEAGLMNQSNVKIYASDINTEVIKHASKGIYDIKKLRMTPQPFIQKYFTEIDSSTFKLDPKVTRNVEFARINLKTDTYPDKMDIIFCRNVMIYFNKEHQTQMVNKFYDALNPDSYFLIGHSESLYFLNNSFTYEKVHDAPVYYKS